MIMKYRWGFLDENDAFSECFPKVDDGTAIDFAPESGEVFYRAKLNGNLSFRYEFDAILAEGYNYEHKIVLQWYDADNDEWKDVWKGRFVLTDCEIDYDTKTITVTPSTLDRYTKILDNLDKEYNIIKLAPAMHPVNILIRPCLQVYLAGESKVSNYIGGNYWETSCDSIVDATEIEINQRLKIYGAFCGIYIEWKSGGLAGKKVVYGGQITNNGSGILKGWVYSGNDGVEDSIDYTATPASGFHNGGTFKFYKGGTLLVTAEIDDFGDVPGVEINDSTLVDGSIVQLDCIYDRFLVQTDEADGAGSIDGIIYDLRTPTVADFAGGSKNYNKYLTIQNNNPIEVYISVETSVDPTVWGQATTDRYFIKPDDTLTDHYMPLGIENWRLVSYWWKAKRVGGIKINDKVAGKFTVTRTIPDSYDYRQTIFRLLEKANVNPQYIISGCLGGSNDYVGTRTNLIITPRSNVISSYYDTPAQNAPISLAKIFSMLKQAFKAYWHIDDNGNLHIEHISYYDNGLNYTDSPQLLVDLESELHTNTKNNKVFGQNKVKFDKQDMPEQYTFGWADAVTRPFTGYPINCLDAYVQKGTKDEKMIGDFDSDVDFVLSSPNDVSKEGFFLFALPPIEGGGYSTTLKINKVTITDEIGDTYEVTIQNGDAAFVKIHETWWRYSLPCENVNINNEDTTAKTTGRFKLQSVEFADTIMAEILKDVDNCNKVLRTQQGDGHIKSISINLNSLVAKGDLLFNFVGRWYYLKGLALGSSFNAIINGETITIEVSANKYSYRYKEPIATLKFAAADVVSVNFGDCDNLDNLTSCDEMFDGCEELLAVDFGGKTFGAVTSANNMFRGCVALTTLICPDSSTWKADLDLSDCPALTLDSVYDLIKFLYFYNAGVHTITPNSTMWNALDADIQDDLIAKATERGWTINIPAQYSVTGESTSSTVYATINGAAVEIPVTGGVWQYDYNAAITSISFENDSNLTKVDFSLSDGLAGLTTLADAFKNCSALTSVDFSNCDLSNVASATDTFAGCVALYELIIPQDTWQPDVDLSDSVMPKAEMLNVINGLYVYTTGTHTITFNSTIWDAMSVADQQAVFDAADAKGWTTNAVMVIYVIRGTSTAASETFNIQFILDGQLSPETAETITVAVDGNGDWEFSYMHKKIYSLRQFAANSTTLLSVNFSSADDFSELTSIQQIFENATALDTIIWSNNDCLKNVTNADQAFNNCTSLLNLNLTNETFTNVTTAYALFNGCSAITTLDLQEAIFDNLTSGARMFASCTALKTLNAPSATFSKITAYGDMFVSSANIETINFHSATFASLTNGQQMFFGKNKLVSLDLSSATFAELTNGRSMFNQYGNHPLQTLNLPEATFAKVTDAFAMFISDGLVTLNIPKATLESVTDTSYMLSDLKNLTTINVPIGTIPKTFGFTRSNSGIALTYQSMVNVANWCKDLTGGTAQTVTFNATAWNGLTSAEQNTIDGILSGKNWNRAIA